MVGLTTLTARDLKARELDAILRQKLAEQSERNRQTDVCFAQSAGLLCQVLALFETKPPDTPIRFMDKDFYSFRVWATARTHGLHNMSVRNAYYFAKMGEHLRPRIGDEAMEAFGIEKCKWLSQYVESKGELPESLLSEARRVSAQDLRSEVERQLYSSNPDHKERWDHMVLAGPKSAVADLRKLIHYGRMTGAGEGMEDVQVIVVMLQSYVQEKAQERRHEHEEASGLSSD